jgi:hypothetical protein
VHCGTFSRRLFLEAERCTKTHGIDIDASGLLVIPVVTDIRLQGRLTVDGIESSVTSGRCRPVLFFTLLLLTTRRYTDPNSRQASGLLAAENYRPTNGIGLRLVEFRLLSSISSLSWNCRRVAGIVVVVRTLTLCAHSRAFDLLLPRLSGANFIGKGSVDYQRVSLRETNSWAGCMRMKRGAKRGDLVLTDMHRNKCVRTR